MIIRIIAMLNCFRRILGVFDRSTWFSFSVVFRSDFRPWPPLAAFHNHFDRNPLDEWSARSGELYLTTHKILKTQTSMPPVGFKPTLQASEWPQNHTVERAVPGIGSVI